MFHTQIARLQSRNFFDNLYLVVFSVTEFQKKICIYRRTFVKLCTILMRNLSNREIVNTLRIKQQ